MGRLIFVTGGARSGKSSFSESLVEGYNDVCYIATAEAYDEEMADRIKLHRAARNPGWVTVESPLSVHEIIEEGEQNHIIVDCLTMLTTNIMLNARTEWEEIADISEFKRVESLVTAEIRAIFRAVEQGGSTVILVSNEVGLGVVPDSALGRAFRDISGRVNQMAAKQAEKVYFMVSGIPVLIKGSQNA